MTAVSEATLGTALGMGSGPGANKTMGKEDFLTLLVAQLKNQDPLNPSDPTEFTAQLAQFSSLEQLFSVNENLNKLAGSQSDFERLSALGLIGREVTAEGDTFRLGNGAVKIGYRLENTASEVRMEIKNSNGTVVDKIAPAGLSTDDYFFSWDGKSLSGAPLPQGSYTISITATDAEGNGIEVTPLVKGVVGGVDLGTKGNVLVTDAGDFSMADVSSVRSL